jgi:lipopolysaccharide/colanic/teichoic acid biosynthesis glycosyltransferase
MGRGGKVFDILKFRTMYEQPADHNGSPITARDDERITPFGRWLRDTKINELPQLWNVLIGQMSFVGPRPEDAEIASAWPEETKKCVLSVRPGITSPASVVYRDEEKLLDSDHVLDEYLRSILPDKLRLDVLYVHDRNFFSDLDVIFMTLIMLLPRIHNISVPEAALYSGPFYNFIRRYASWFVVDGLTALVAIVITGAFWRMGGPLNIGLDKAIGIAFAMSFMMSLSNTVLGLKKIVWKYASPTYVIDLGLSVMLSLLILWIIDEHVLPHALLPSEMILDFGFLTFFGFVISRYRERLITGLASRWVQLRGKTNVVDERVLVVGAGECGELAIWMMNKSHYATAFSVVGFVDDDFRKQDYTMKGYPILGTTRDIPELVKRRNIGLILFAISRCTHKERERILAICRSTPARLVIIPDFINLFKRSLEKQSVEEAA